MIELFDDDDNPINEVCVPTDPYHSEKGVQTDPPSHLPRSECTIDEVALYPSATTEIVDVELAVTCPKALLFLFAQTGKTYHLYN